jgi:hypothetical protein
VPSGSSGCRSDFVRDAKPNLTLLQPSYFCHKKILGVGFRFEQNHSLSTGYPQHTLAIITYVRTSYFKGTSQISEVLWKYFGSDEVLLKYVMYLLLLKYKIAISVSNPSISTMTSGMLFISILYSLFILYSSAHLCRQPSVSRRHPAASGHGHGHGGWRRVHGGYALAEASASASAAVTSRSRTHHYHSQSLSHTHTHLTITIHTLISASPPPMQND